MELALTKTITDRSLQRRWALTNAKPLRAALPPYVEFVPADLRIWWSISDDREPTCRIYAWPAERSNTVFAHREATAGRQPATVPAWVRELADSVHADLAATRTSSNTGIQDRWAHTLTHRWEVTGAEAIPSLRRPAEVFIPGELDVWWSITAGAPERENRYAIHAYPGRRDRSAGAQWSGTHAWYRDMPDWIRELADRQYDELAETARAAAVLRAP